MYVENWAPPNSGVQDVGIIPANASYAEVTPQADPVFITAHGTLSPMASLAKLRTSMEHRARAPQYCTTRLLAIVGLLKGPVDPQEARMRDGASHDVRLQNHSGADL